MVDTTAMLEAEEWMREWGLPKQFDGMKFCKLKLKLKWGGEFEFDAVSEDRTIACCISTSRTMNPGQERKILADAFYPMRLSPNPDISCSPKKTYTRRSRTK